MLKFCGCKWCRRNRHKPQCKEWIKRKVRTFRQQSKRALRNGEEPPKYISVEYTA